MHSLHEITTLLGEKLIEADILKHSITADQFAAQQDRWGQTFAMFMVGLLIGAVIGCRLVVLAAR